MLMMQRNTKFFVFKIPWLENAFPFFQVFQSEWEPWVLLEGWFFLNYDQSKPLLITKVIQISRDQK